MVRSPPAGDYWPRNDAVPAHAYTQSSKQPNNGHSYWQPQFCDATDKFFRITHYQTWENDTAPIPGVNYVHRLDWATKQWALSDDTSRSPDLPTDAKTGWDGAWCCKHPVSEQIYRPTQFLIHRFDPKGNGGIGIWYSWQYSSANPGVDRGTGCVDPDHELILVIGRRPVDQLDHKPIVYDISSGKPYAVTNNAIFTGPYAASIRNYNQVWGAGMVWDAGLHCFLWYQNDTYVYTIRRGATNAEWIVDRLPLTGTPPVANVDYTYGRMQYAPNLKGVVMMLRMDNNCWFIRTS